MREKQKEIPICVLSYLDKIGYPNKDPRAFTDHTTYFTTKIDHTYTLQRSIDKRNQDNLTTPISSKENYKSLKEKYNVHC